MNQAPTNADVFDRGSIYRRVAPSNSFEGVTRLRIPLRGTQRQAGDHEGLPYVLAFSFLLLATSYVLPAPFILPYSKSRLTYPL